MANPTFPSAIMDSDSPLNKRRRFAPNSIPSMPPRDNSAIQNYIFDAPLLGQAPFCGKPITSEEIEAQLLQVGMRVRKSINDGYQKDKRFTPRPFFNMHRLSPETQAALCGSSVREETASDLHNVGGMVTQPARTATFCGISLAALGHISPAPVFEEQRMWSYSTSAKRGYEGESDSDDQEFLPQTPIGDFNMSVSMPADYFGVDWDGMSDVSPFSRPASSEVLHTQVSGRRLAKTRSRKQQQAAHGTQSSNPFAQMTMTHPPADGTQWMGHRRINSCGLEANMMNDFGEAGLLQRSEDMEMDCS